MLIVVSSRYGQTRKIAEIIADDLRRASLTVDVRDVQASDLGAPTEYRAVLVAGSVIATRHAKSLVRWVRDHREAIAARINAFASVSLSAHSDVPSDRAGLQAVVVRNGEPADFATVEGADWSRTWHYDVAAGGDRFRLELADGALPVVVTNHTYVAHDGSSAGGCCSGSQGLPALPCLLVALGLLRRRARV